MSANDHFRVRLDFTFYLRDNVVRECIKYIKRGAFYIAEFHCGTVYGIAVSYTHLDVYKRQVKKRFFDFFSLGIGAFIVKLKILFGADEPEILLPETFDIPHALVVTGKKRIYGIAYRG